MKTRALNQAGWRPFCILALFLSLLPASAETGHSPQNIRSVFITGLDASGSTAAIRRVMIERLTKNGSLVIAPTESSADAVLRIKSTIWQTGTVSLNPRSHSNRLINYQGYASAELYDHSNQILWSYLATPGRYRFATITDGLADQLSTQLIDASRSGFAPAATSALGAQSTNVLLHAAGATFPAPLYLKWFESFKQQPGGSPITYDDSGSISGMEQLAAGKIDLAASDIPDMATISSPSTESKTETKKDTNDILILPSVVGAVVPIYNLSGSIHDLNLTPQLLADIYSGNIRRWNDPRIRQENRSAHLPDADITVVHRSDGSGTTYVWTSFLATASPDWKPRAGASAQWPTGIGETGNQGVADRVASARDAIGYVELTYAIQHHLNYAAVRNPAGRFIKADLDSLTAAASSIRSDTTGQGLSLLNAPAKNAYPISTFTYFLLLKTNPDPSRRAALSSFLRWMLTSGQHQCSSLGYAPLPRDLAASEIQSLSTLK